METPSTQIPVALENAKLNATMIVEEMDFMPRLAGFLAAYDATEKAQRIHTPLNAHAAEKASLAFLEANKELALELIANRLSSRIAAQGF